jgi:hypothetical protein
MSQANRIVVVRLLIAAAAAFAGLELRRRGLSSGQILLVIALGVILVGMAVDRTALTLRPKVMILSALLLIVATCALW